MFGYFGGAVNVTDGRYTYHRYPEDLERQEIYQYTLMPTHIFGISHPRNWSQATLSEPLPFTRGRGAEGSGEQSLADVPAVRPARCWNRKPAL